MCHLASPTLSMGCQWSPQRAFTLGNFCSVLDVFFLFPSHSFDACSLGYTILFSACPHGPITTSSHQPKWLVLGIGQVPWTLIHVYISTSGESGTYRCYRPDPCFPKKLARDTDLPPQGADSRTRCRYSARTLRYSQGQDSNPGRSASAARAAYFSLRSPSLLQPAGLVTAVNSGNPTELGSNISGPLPPSCSLSPGKISLSGRLDTLALETLSY